MALANLVRETISTTGQVTENIQLSGAVAGYKSFSDEWPSGATGVHVLFIDGLNRAVATATYDHAADQLDIVTVESIISGTAGTTDLTFTAGAQVMVVAPASLLELLDFIDQDVRSTASPTFNNMNLDGKVTVDGGAKLGVQNKVDGGSGNGIFLWDTDDTDHGVYMSLPGATKSLSDGIACSSLDSRTGFIIRNRINASSERAFVWENHNEVCLMSLTADTGDLYALGDIILSGIAGNQIQRSIDTDSLTLTSSKASNVGGNISLFGGSHATLANDTRFRAGASVWLYWDDSLNTATLSGKLAIDGVISLSAPTELTINAGAITITKSFHTIDTEGDSSPDDLDTINGGTDGAIITLRAEHTDRTVVLKAGTGNIDISSDITLDDTQKTVALIYDGTNWLRHNGA